MTRPRTTRLFGLILLVVVVDVATTQGVASPRASAYFLPQDEIPVVQISPGGEWIVALAANAESSGLLAQRFGSAEVAAVHTSRREPRVLSWLGRNRLLAQFDQGQERVFLLVEFIPDEISGFEFKKKWIRPPGQLVDPLPLIDDRVVWEYEIRGNNSVHHLTIDELQYFKRHSRVRRSSVRIGDMVASIKGIASRWVVDRQGYPMAALRWDENGHTLLYRSDRNEKFEEVLSFETDSLDFVNPFGLIRNSENLIVSAYNKGDTIGIFEFDPRMGKIVREIYVRDDADITDVYIDPVTQFVLYVVYEIGGERRRHYLESSRAAFADRLGEGAPSIDSIDIVSSTADRQRFVYWNSGSTEPGVHHLRSVATNETIRIGQRGAKIDRNALSPAESFHVTSMDGTRVEAFLTRPLSPIAEKTPLVVFPHGGPIGVRDSAQYDPMVQYLASWGFATLQVNYRGSSGYGRKFEEAGKKQWARGIEDDIDAAVEHVMAFPEIDENHMCIIGGSYGGFSATASVIRHSERYRCAVTINGVSDIPLMSESSDFADSARVLKIFEENAGSLEEGRDKLIAISPAYHLKYVETPILVIYGDADRRVDPDHAHRVLLMLRLYGKKYEEIRVKDGAHSFNRDQWVRVLPPLREFLTKYLMPSRAFQRDPKTPPGN